MERQARTGLAAAAVTRRRLLGAGIVGAAAFGLASCDPSAPKPRQRKRPDGGSLVFLSTQLGPVEEAEKMRKRILAGYDRTVSFAGWGIDSLVDRLRAEATARRGRVALVAGQHSDLASLAADGLLLDLGDLAGDLRDRNFTPEFLKLAHLGRGTPIYIPWMQATYLMAARKEAVELLPAGTAVGALRYDQLLDWATRVNREQGGRKLGFPAAHDGLLHRFLQGYAYPSFTGALHKRFKSAKAVAMWEWMRRAWAESNDQSLTYAYMQQPLQSGEVWIAWDHIARLVEALKAGPAEFVPFPAPTGPAGLGYIPVLIGLAIPKSSPDHEGAKRLIRYLTEPSTSKLTFREVGFFPPNITFQPSGDYGAGIRAEAKAVRAQTTSPKALASLLPVGLKDQFVAYDDVFRSVFHEIVVRDRPIRATLEVEGGRLQRVLDSVQAPCWQPDPTSRGTCRVGD